MYVYANPYYRNLFLAAQWGLPFRRLTIYATRRAAVTGHPALPPTFVHNGRTWRMRDFTS
jgi:hypothetical protein